MGWILNKLNSIFFPNHLLLLDKVRESRATLDETKQMIKQFKAHIDREEIWFTCECSEKPKPQPKESVNNVCNPTFSHGSSSHHMS
jgi:hypothetical protein